jgi:hypothetical protein
VKSVIEQAEGQHFRMAGLNLLAAIIIYWNTKHLGQAVASRRSRFGLLTKPAGAYLAPRMGAHPSHRRIQMAQKMTKPP